MADPQEPSYYLAGEVSTNDVIKAKLAALTNWPPYACFLYGNILKYALRLPFKGEISKDLDKLIHYSQKLKEETCP